MILIGKYAKGTYRKYGVLRGGSGGYSSGRILYLADLGFGLTE